MNNYINSNIHTVLSELSQHPEYTIENEKLCFPKEISLDQKINSISLYVKAHQSEIETADIQHLKKIKANFLQETHDLATQGKINDLFADILIPVKSIQPIPLSIYLLEQLYGDPGSLVSGAATDIQNDLPVVITKSLLYSYPIAFQHLLKDKDIYEQENGQFILILPKNSNMPSLGFNAESLKPTKVDDLLNKEIVEPTANIELNLKQLFINETDDKIFKRAIVLDGHGIFPSQDRAGYITGIEVPVFQNVLQILKDYNTSFLAVQSCFSGGANATDIHLPDETIPYPILLVGAATEDPTQGPVNGAKSLLQKSIQFLFKGKEGKLTETSLTQNHLHQITNEIIPRQNAPTFISTFFLPKSAKDIPQIAYTSTQEALDLGKTMQHIHHEKLAEFLREKYKLHALEEKPIENIEAPSENYIEIESSRPRHSDVYLSRPVNNLQLGIPTGPIEESFYLTPKPAFGFVSRGGKAFHYISEVDAEHNDFETIASQTFNRSGLAASKTFIIGKIHCDMDDKPVILNNVVISFSDKRCFVMYTQEGKIIKEPFAYNRFGAWTPGYDKEIIDQKKMNLELFKAIASSTPSQNALSQITPERESTEEFISLLNQSFFNDEIPIDVKLYEGILFPQDIFSKDEKGQIIHSTSSFEAFMALEGLTSKERSPLLNNAYKLSKLSGQDKIAKFMLEMTETKLIRAVKAKDLKSIEQADPSQLLFPDASGRRPLHYAVMDSQQTLIELVIQKNPLACLFPDEEGMNPFHLAAKIGKANLCKIMLENHKKLALELIVLTNEEGNNALFTAIKYKHREVIDLLLDTLKEFQNAIEPKVIKRVFSADSGLYLKNEDTPLMLASAQGDIETLDKIFKDFRMEFEAFSLADHCEVLKPALASALSSGQIGATLSIMEFATALNIRLPFAMDPMTINAFMSCLSARDINGLRLIDSLLNQQEASEYWMSALNNPFAGLIDSINTLFEARFGVGVLNELSDTEINSLYGLLNEYQIAIPNEYLEKRTK